MQNKTTIQSIIAAVLILLLLIVWNPFHTWMPDMMVMTILICILIIFIVFVSIVLSEAPGDEREGLHRNHAGRVAFLAGSTVLVIGIIRQTFTHHVDLWLITTLVVMLVAKISTRVYNDHHH